MFISDIKRVVEQVSRDKGIDRNILIKALEEALVSAARKKFGGNVDIEVQYNESTGEIEVFQFKDVAEVVTEPDLQISMKEGRKLDPDCEIGDSLGTKMDTSTFRRIAAQSAKQVIIQKMKDAERDAVYSSLLTERVKSSTESFSVLIGTILLLILDIQKEFFRLENKSQRNPTVVAIA